nr:ribonuclease H-like domain-containing protein [Tanacetum cinerariifolium]
MVDPGKKPEEGGSGNDVYDPIRSTLLTTKPLPTGKEVFSLLLMDESHRNIHFVGSGVKTGSSAFVSKFDNKESVLFTAKSTDNKKRFNNNNNNIVRNPSLVCKHCNMNGHTVERLCHPTDQVLSVLKDDSDLKGDFSSEPCYVCHRAKETRKPFPLSDHQSETIGDDENATNPPPVPPTPQAPHTLSTIKLLILKKGEYDTWAIKMEHYLGHIDYPIWEVIQKGNGHVQVSTNTHGQIRVLPPKTAEEILARERERKAMTTLLMAIPEDHLAKFHKITDAKEIWEAIKSIFCRNDESKKMQKYILKQQFESFSVSNSEGLHKGYDRFQSLLSQLETHGVGVSTEDANQKF